MSALTLPACLITQPVQFEAPATFPPSIESAPAAVHPLDDIVRLQRDGNEMLEFEVVVRDPDVDETLEYLLYIDYIDAPGVGAHRFEDILPIDRAVQTDRSRRPVVVTVGQAGTALAIAGCHRVEMRVSSDFRTQSPAPVIDGDIGSAVWWVATADGAGVDMVACP